DPVEFGGHRLGEARGAADPAAEHDQVGGDDGDDRADGLGHQPRLFGHDGLGPLVPVRRGLEDAPRGHRTAHPPATRGAPSKIPEADAPDSSVPRLRASCSSAPAPPDSGMNAISPATPWAPRTS